MGENFDGVSESLETIGDQSTERILLRSCEETIALGEKLNQNLTNLNLLLLEGPLGAGKTSLVKGIANSLGISEPITSPTFALSQHYPNGSRNLIHLDLYRLEDQSAADELFLQEEECANSQKGLIVVEWPERLSLSLKDAWKIKLAYTSQEGRSAQIISPIN